MTIFRSQSEHPNWFHGRHFMFVPIETPSILPRQRLGGLIILSGVVDIGFNNSFNTEPLWGQVILNLDEDFGLAIRSAPYTPPPAEQFRFSIAQVVPFATASDCRAERANHGEVVYAFWSSPGGPTIQIEVAVTPRSVIHRLAYHLSLYGHLVASGGVAPEASTAQADAPAASTAQADAAADSLDK